VKDWTNRLGRRLWSLSDLESLCVFVWSWISSYVRHCPLFSLESVTDACLLVAEPAAVWVNCYHWSDGWQWVEKYADGRILSKKVRQKALSREDSSLRLMGQSLIVKVKGATVLN